MAKHPVQTDRNSVRVAGGYTPPKGKPTPGRGEPRPEQRYKTNRRVWMEWAAVALVGVLIVVGLMFAFGGSVSDGRRRPVGIHGG